MVASKRLALGPRSRVALEATDGKATVGLCKRRDYRPAECGPDALQMSPARDMWRALFAFARPWRTAMEHLGSRVEGVSLSRLVASLPLIAASLAHYWRVNPVSPIAELGRFAESAVRDDPAAFWLLRRWRFEWSGNGGRIRLFHGLLELHQYREVLRVHGIRL